MGLRRQYPDRAAIYPDPQMGINLRSSIEDLLPMEARLMQNCIYDGGIRKRSGSERLTPTALASNLRIRGGHKFYRADTTSQRLVAYGTKISVVNTAGVETVLTSGMTNDRDTHFLTWPITDACYICNGVDTLRKVTNTGTLSTVTGTNIPAPTMLAPIGDRLLAITTNGIERSDPRSDSVWSSNSSWATFRPSLVGRFTALYPFSVPTPNAQQPVTPLVVAFQANAYYYITGTDFGADVTAASPSSGEDARILLKDSRVGTSSPYSVTVVPGLGMFWFTTDLNVYWLPQDGSPGRYIGDKIISTGSSTGINGVNKSALGQVWMAYFDRKLMLGFPTGSDTYPSTQYWMDTKAFIERPDLGPVWYGPMTGSTVGRVWTETQNGENVAYGGEGNPSTGAFIYEIVKSGIYTDAVGTTDTNISMRHITHYKPLGFLEREKYLRAVQFNLNSYTGTATCRILDLEGAITPAITIEPVS